MHRFPTGSSNSIHIDRARTHRGSGWSESAFEINSIEFTCTEVMCTPTYSSPSVDLRHNFRICIAHERCIHYPFRDLHTIHDCRT